jgi:protein associated with RNAse G/E
MYLLEYYEVDCMPRAELNQYYIELLSELSRLNDMVSYIEVRLDDLEIE